ncbi:helix-turn-helix domain-containing protein [Streptomyces sp. NPDC048182]|uniref:transcriptional regulator n=1 Tax=Streptomyces sp. NPDC048182 TaxID=3365507 RepID=UPI003715140E
MESGAGGAETEGFAELLRALKDRSGLSYGALAKRLHMSTSTLHRYCNGSAVPADYAPVERLARVCRATPEELVELHRRWILADAARGRKGTPGSTEPAPAVEEPDQAPAPAPSTGVEPAADEAPPGAAESPAAPGPRSRRRTALIASAAAVAVLGAAALAVGLPGSGGDDGDRTSAGAAAPVAPTRTATGTERPARPSASATTSPAPSASRRAPTHGPATTPPPRRRSTAPEGGTGAEETGGVPVRVATRPYVYDSPCSQHFLVDSEPEQVGPPPPTEQDAPRWAAAYGGVSSGEQRVALTVQGTGEDTVVLESLHVRVLAKGAPLAWNDYSMGVGCGGGVGTASFGVDLDAGSPVVGVQNGQRDFPYKVSESDPEVFYLVARTKAHDVRWDLTLTWSSGGRRGSVHIDNDGTAFRTSADVDRPGYDYPLGGGEWIDRVEQE